VTVRLVTAADEWYGLSERDRDLARRISTLARELGVPAGPEGNKACVATAMTRGWAAGVS
jgi:hypothetical protein